VARDTRRHLNGHRTRKIVPNGSNIKVELARHEPARRKGVAPLVIGNHGDAYRFAFPFSSDQDTFHRPFGIRTHTARKRRGSGFLSGNSVHDSDIYDQYQQGNFHPHLSTSLVHSLVVPTVSEQILLDISEFLI
jgi:hypothetical protein